jgi:hypothetical protein
MSSALESSYVGMLQWMMTSRSCDLLGGSWSMICLQQWWMLEALWSLWKGWLMCVSTLFATELDMCFMIERMYVQSHQPNEKTMGCYL